MKTIERLRELLDKCKFGTTKVERHDGDMEVGVPDQFDVIAENGDAIAAMYLREQSRCEDGAALLSESCNALPALLAVVEAQAAEIRAWRDLWDAMKKDHNGPHTQKLLKKLAAEEKTDALRALEGGVG